MAARKAGAPPPVPGAADITEARPLPRHEALAMSMAVAPVGLVEDAVDAGEGGGKVEPELGDELALAGDAARGGSTAL